MVRTCLMLHTNTHWNSELLWKMDLIIKFWNFEFTITFDLMKMFISLELYFVELAKVCVILFFPFTLCYLFIYFNFFSIDA